MMQVDGRIPSSQYTSREQTGSDNGKQDRLAGRHRPPGSSRWVALDRLAIIDAIIINGGRLSVPTSEDTTIPQNLTKGISDSSIDKSKRIPIFFRRVTGTPASPPEVV